MKIINKGIYPFNINQDLKDRIKEIIKIIDKNFSGNVDNLIKMSNAEYSKLVYDTQEKINQIFNPKIFILSQKKLINQFFKSKSFYTQRYFYLRAQRPNQTNKVIPPINLHRESMFGPASYKTLVNLWIPIKNNCKSNSVFYVPNSHKFIENKDFIIKEGANSKFIKKGSSSHKIGLLYKEKNIVFLKKIKKKRMFFKNKGIFFSGELIHGNAINLLKKIRFSLDCRLTNNMKINNPLQGATNTKYLEKINI